MSIQTDISVIPWHGLYDDILFIMNERRYSFLFFYIYIKLRRLYLFDFDLYDIGTRILFDQFSFFIIKEYDVRRMKTEVLDQFMKKGRILSPDYGTIFVCDFYFIWFIIDQISTVLKKCFLRKPVITVLIDPSDFQISYSITLTLMMFSTSFRAFLSTSELVSIIV